MESTQNKHHSTARKRRLILAVAIAAVVIVLSSVVGVKASKLSSDKIYPGVFIGDIDVGGMRKEEASAAVNETYSFDTESELTLTSGSETRSLKISSLSPSADLEACVEAAYQAGRSGSVFERLREINRIKNETLTIEIELTLNHEVLLESVQSIASIVDQPEQDNQFEIKETELIITRGHSGKRIIPEHAEAAVKESLLKKEKSVELILEPVYPAEITADYVCENVCGDPVNATYRVENYKLVIEDEKIGVSMDKTEAEKRIQEATGETITIPITTKHAEISADDIRSSLFQDQLGTYTTRFNAGDTNRSYNISLACKNINEIVLAPGDVFSYNDIVGPRTASRGFRTANVYVGNKVEDGIGGGICQVSSTLYNTVVLSDLKIVSRTNHSLPVSYVPMGRDATVSYGSIDFKFENNTSEPIKIVATARGGQNTISIYGKKEHPNRTISIECECVATYPAKLEQKNDPNLLAGEIKVEQKGSDGSTYNSYKITKENGQVISRDFLAKSTYVSVNRVELVGTKPPDPSSSATPDGSADGAALSTSTEQTSVQGNGTNADTSPKPSSSAQQ